jgi:hypothetical protein
VNISSILSEHCGTIIDNAFKLHSPPISIVTDRNRIPAICARKFSNPGMFNLNRALPITPKQMASLTEGINALNPILDAWFSKNLKRGSMALSLAEWW